jgi:hypothetical protein
MQDKQIAGGSGLSEGPLKPEPHSGSTFSQSLLISSLKLRRGVVRLSPMPAVAVSDDIMQLSICLSCLMQPTYHTCACFLRWFRQCSHQSCQCEINLVRDRKCQRRHLWQKVNWLNFLRMSCQRYGCTVSDRAVSSIANLEELTRQ